jgi:hypothetical protein
MALNRPFAHTCLKGHVGGEATTMRNLRAARVAIEAFVPAKRA